MSVAPVAALAVDSPPERPPLEPRFFDPDDIVIPDDNPPRKPALQAALEQSMSQLTQMLPGFVGPSPYLPPEKRLCLEGCGRLIAARKLGLRFWAFDLGRFVDEAERIELVCHHHSSRRSLGRDELVDKASRYMELKGCTAAAAASLLNISEATLSRAFGDRRIPPELKARTDLLNPTIRSLVAAVPLEQMEQVTDFAVMADSSGRRPTRDRVAAYIRELKRSGTQKGRKPKTVTLWLNGRAVTLSVAEKESAISVAEDLKSLSTRLSKLTDVEPNGWPFLFKR